MKNSVLIKKYHLHRFVDHAHTEMLIIPEAWWN